MKKLLSTTVLSLLLVSLASGVYGQDAPDFEETKALAEQGEAFAQFNLGVMYNNGLGVPKNDAEAVRWYKLAAEQGEALAQFNLGVMYYNGLGVPQNNVRAYVWWSVAAAQGIGDARTNRDIFSERLAPEQLTRGQDMATRCFESDFQDCE